MSPQLVASKPERNNRLKKSQIKKMVDNYYSVIKKKDANGNIVDLNRETDAKCIWFPKSEIDKLFADHHCNAQNNDEFGLRIYFGVYGDDMPEGVPAHYKNQQTVMLVATRKQGSVLTKDILKEDHDHAADGKGDGSDGTNDSGYGTSLNHGSLCPPGSDCGQSTGV